MSSTRYTFKVLCMLGIGTLSIVADTQNTVWAKTRAQSVFLMHRHHQRPGAGHAIQSITQHPPALSGQD